MANQSQHVNSMMFSTSMPYDMYQYGATPANFYPTQGKIPVEFATSTSDEKDRRRKRSDASKSSGEKEITTNMHLVSTFCDPDRAQANFVAAKKSTKSSISKSLSRAQREARQRSRASTRRITRKASRLITVIQQAGGRSLQAQRKDI